MLSISVIVMVFLRAQKRIATMSTPTTETSVTSQSQVQEDGSVAVSISDTPVAEKVAKERERGSDEEQSQDEQIAEREKMLIKRIAHNPRDAEAYDLLGQVYLVQNNLQDAAECFDQVVALDPKNLRAVEQLKKIDKIRHGSAE